MASITQPVAVVTAAEQTHPLGMTVGSFVSVSLDPQLVSVSLHNGSRTLAAALATGRLGISVLGADAAPIGAQFAARGRDRFAGIAWTMQAGLPRLTAAPTWISCRVAQAIPAGDHRIVLAAVQAVEHRPGATLTYRDRTFGTHVPVTRPSTREGTR
ncbi:flavin reductase family protein [Nocardia sp. NPDC024068]|uniref:flavin reductase family protein n=1 Tax=Nocardia sp. NPDC024068 TaxID=3157197 RepID=UPI0033C3B63A